MKQGHEKGSAFAICTATFQRGGKPIHVGEAENQKLHLFSESISIAGNKVSGVAIHPRRIFHPEENVTHVYLREELEKAAPTLIGKPFGIDHQYVLPPPNLITNAWYDSKENGVAFEGIVEDKIAEQIRNQVFKGLSIELDWLKPGGKIEYVDGIAPRNFELTSVHLLKKFPPGDRDAFIKLWNGIMEQLVMGPALPLDRRVEAVEKQIHEIFNQIAVINGKLEVMIGKEPSQTSLTPQMQETEWTAEYIGSLPDTAFAVISPGGEKDKQSKTVPRSLRHLPHHNAQGDTDLPHLRNALSRLPQTNLSSEEQSEAKRHLCAHANELGIISDVCELEPRIKESEDIVALRKKVFNLQVKLGESEKISQALKKRHADFRKLVESVIPQPSIFGAWRPGSRLMIQQLQRILRESSDSVNASHGQAEWRDRKY
jgi:hypothetical protein